MKLMEFVVAEAAILGSMYLASELVKGIQDNPDVFLDAVNVCLQSRCNSPVKTMRYQRVEWIEVTEWTGYVPAPSK